MAALRTIDYTCQQCSNRDLDVLLNLLIAIPNQLDELLISGNRLTDATGMRVACLLATSTTIKKLNMSHNQFSTATYMAVADALQTNTSLVELDMSYNEAGHKEMIDAEFVRVLQRNPTRPPFSQWSLYARHAPDYERLRDLAFPSRDHQE